MVFIRLTSFSVNHDGKTSISVPDTTIYQRYNDQRSGPKQPQSPLEGTVLKLTPGSDSPKVKLEVVAEYTIRALQRTMPTTVSAVVFQSRGQSRGEATHNLNAMNQLKGKNLWSLSFSFGRALQQSTQMKWVRKENIYKAQASFSARCKANSEATLGTYKGDVVLAEGAIESLHVKDYNY